MADLKVSEHVRVYKGAEGVRVSVVNLLPEDGRRALVEVRGLDSALAGVVLPHEVLPARESAMLRTRIEGSPFVTLGRQRWGWDRAERIRLYLPDQEGGLDVAYDEKASRRARGEELLNRHLRQLGEGVIDRIRSFDRETAVRRATQGLERASRELQELTGAPLPFEVRWDTVPDALFMEADAAALLETPYAALRRLCTRSGDGEAFRTRVAARLKKVVCGAAPDRMRIRVDADGAVHWTTAPEEYNQDDFSLYCLQNEL